MRYTPKKRATVVLSIQVAWHPGDFPETLLDHIAERLPDRIEKVDVLRIDDIHAKEEQS